MRLKMTKYIIAAATLILASCSSSNNTHLTGNWIEVMPVNRNIVQGITLDADGKAKSIGMATLQYEKWKAEAGKLILWGKSIGNGQTIDFSDTLTIIKATSDSLLLGKDGMYRISYYKVSNIEDVKPFNVLDSLKTVEGLTELETRTYRTEGGSELIIHNYKHSGDGVYELNGSNYGRLYTLRGDAENPDAVVYQLVPFNGGTMINLLYQGDKLLLLNDKFEKRQEPAASDIYSIMSGIAQRVKQR